MHNHSELLLDPHDAVVIDPYRTSVSGAFDVGYTVGQLFEKQIRNSRGRRAMGKERLEDRTQPTQPRRDKRRLG